ncbi:hypothetical protein CCP3SC1_920001 [Gammaproteobacteria bacterium]
MTVETVQDPILSLNDLLALGEETLTGVSQVTLNGLTAGKDRHFYRNVKDRRAG